MGKILITGGAGFIGSNLVEALVMDGEDVRVLDNFSTGKRENIAHLLGQIELIEGDIRDLDLVRKACKGIEYILHQAALPSIARSIEDPATTNGVNTEGTLNLLLAAREMRVKRLIYASSSSIYGDSPVLPKREEMSPNPLSPYAVSKLCGEYYCRVFNRVYGLEVVILRYFNVFGPRQDPSSPYSAAIPRFINRMLDGTPPEIYGDGLQGRDFTYVDNVVQANLLAIRRDGASGQVFNIGCGKETNLLELVDILNRIIGSNLSPTHTEPRPGDVRHSMADISKAKDVLGYMVRVDLKEGLKRTAEWMG
jgi:UDP-glucose 4-epimerase